MNDSVHKTTPATSDSAPAQSAHGTQTTAPGADFTAELTVRSYECDSYGHVNNAVYLNYLEHARLEFLNAIGFDFPAITEEGFYLYVTHIDIHYKASAFLGETLRIAVTPVKTGAVSGTFRQIVQKTDGTVCAEAEVSWASVNAKTQRPARLPAHFLVSGLYPKESA